LLKRSDIMTNKDIEYLKNKTDGILEQVKATNGTVRYHDSKIIKLEQNQSNHFRNHDNERINKKLLFWGAIIFIIFQFLLDLLKEYIRSKLSGG